MAGVLDDLPTAGNHLGKRFRPGPGTWGLIEASGNGVLVSEA